MNAGLNPMLLLIAPLVRIGFGIGKYVLKILRLNQYIVV